MTPKEINQMHPSTIQDIKERDKMAELYEKALADLRALLIYDDTLGEENLAGLNRLDKRYTINEAMRKLTEDENDYLKKRQYEERN